jgi:hypothetical protein
MVGGLNDEAATLSEAVSAVRRQSAGALKQLTIREGRHVIDVQCTQRCCL